MLGTDTPGDLFAEGGDVSRMVHLAVKRKLRMYDEYHDLDAESLYADVMGEVVRSWHTYDPTKRQPKSHAYDVAWRRLMDISRRRTLESQRQQEGREMGEVSRGDVEPDETPEEVAEGLYEQVKAKLKAKGIPLRTPHCGRTYLNRAQRLTLYTLQQRMGWSSRQAEAAMYAHPGVLQVIGASQPLSASFFLRAAGAASQLTKFLAASETTPAA